MSELDGRLDEPCTRTYEHHPHPIHAAARHGWAALTFVCPGYEIQAAAAVEDDPDDPPATPDMDPMWGRAES